MGGCQYAFCLGFSSHSNEQDSSWVIVDRITKFTQFVAVKTSFLVEDNGKLYIKEIVKLHGVPLSIISDRGTQCTFFFWKAFQNGLGSNVKLSFAFHP